MDNKKDHPLLKAKPDLKLCPNHFHAPLPTYQIWRYGQAVRNDEGWYRFPPPKKRAGGAYIPPKTKKNETAKMQREKYRQLARSLQET